MWITFFLSYFQVIFVLTCPTVLYPLGCRFDSGRTIKAGQRFARIGNDSQLKPEPESGRTQFKPDIICLTRGTMPDVIQVSHDSVRFDLGHVSKTCIAEANGQLIRGLLVTLWTMNKLSRWGQWPTCHDEAYLSYWGQRVTLRPMANLSEAYLSRWGLLVTLRPTSLRLHR